MGDELSRVRVNTLLVGAFTNSGEFVSHASLFWSGKLAVLGGKVSESNRDNAKSSREK